MTMPPTGAYQPSARRTAAGPGLSPLRGSAIASQPAQSMPISPKRIG